MMGRDDNDPLSEQPRPVLAGGGELGQRMREIDWARTPLGPVESWPQSLKTCVRIILTSRQPMFVWWGDELINLYNDAYKSIVGGKHPEALGQPARIVWREIWDQVGPRAETAMRAQEGTYDEALLLIMERHGYEEETYYTFSYSPVPNDRGGTGGILCANTADTERIVGERQLVLLRELAIRTADARSWQEACRASAGALATNPRDVPFALLYVLDPDQRRFDLAGAAGIAEGHAGAPLVVDGHGSPVWPLAEVAGSSKLLLLDDLVDRFGELPGGIWPRSPRQAALVPIAPAGETGRTGVLVVGLNPFRLFDERYRRFLELTAGQIAASIASAQAYEDERERAEALAKIDRAKTAFFGNVSHEFRTPLTLLLGPVEDLLRGAHGELDAARRSQLELVHRNALRLQQLVNSLLEFSRLEAGRAQASYEPVDLAALTRDVASAFQSAVEQAGLRFEIDCPPLPEPVFVDPAMWEKIVLNLVSNAFKFTFEGRITVSLRAEGDSVVLHVEDTGVGVPRAEVPRLFERFHRIEGTRARTHEGSGIGLALVQELAGLHGGVARARSVLGSGSTFTVTIPRGSEHLPKDRIGAPRAAAATVIGAAPFVQEALRWLPNAPADAADGERPRLSADAHEPPRAGDEPVAVGGPAGGTILLADDNTDMRDYVRRLLEPYWAVEAVEDGEKALAVARARPPDLILTDVMMPAMDGFALLRELRREDATRSIPVVMLSARAGEEAKVEGLAAGADDYLVKPFSARELLARVRTHLELGHLRKQLHARHEHLLSLFKQAPAVICVLRGQELVFEMANDLFTKVAGGRQVVDKRLLEALPELAGQGFDELLLEVMRTGVPRVGREVPARLARNGSGALEDTYWTFVFARLESEDDVERVMVVASEVTDQVLTRRLIEQSEERFRRIVDQVQAGIAQTDLDGRFTLVNERYREIAGRPTPELLELRLDRITHPEDGPHARERLLAVIERGTPATAEERYVRPDGSFVWVQSSVSRIDDRRGRPQGVAVVAIDVTQRKQAEQALRESEERFIRLYQREQRARAEAETLARVAEQALKFSETFVGILGHDLRSPLSAITTSADLLLHREANDRITRPIERIRTSAHRMARMIEQILDFTRARIGGGIPIAPAPMQLQSLATQLVGELEGAAPQPILFEAVGDTGGEWDSDRLAQVISNLLGNAVEHGEPHAPIRVRLDGTAPDEVHLSVWNAGVVPEQILPNLFDPFRRTAGEGGARRPQGLGLGLYIVEQVVAAHGGRIDVQSSANEGTSFVITLPRRGSKQSAPAA